MENILAQDAISGASKVEIGNDSENSDVEKKFNLLLEEADNNNLASKEDDEISNEEADVTTLVIGEDRPKPEETRFVIEDATFEEDETISEEEVTTLIIGQDSSQEKDVKLEKEIATEEVILPEELVVPGEEMTLSKELVVPEEEVALSEELVVPEEEVALPEELVVPGEEIIAPEEEVVTIDNNSDSFSADIDQISAEKVLEVVEDAASVISDGIVSVVDSVKEGLYIAGETAVENTITVLSDAANSYDKLFDDLDGYTDENLLRDAALANYVDPNPEGVPGYPLLVGLKHVYEGEITGLSAPNTPITDSFLTKSDLDVSLNIVDYDKITNVNTGRFGPIVGTQPLVFSDSDSEENKDEIFTNTSNLIGDLIGDFNLTGANNNFNVNEQGVISVDNKVTSEEISDYVDIQKIIQDNANMGLLSLPGSYANILLDETIFSGKVFLDEPRKPGEEGYNPGIEASRNSEINGLPDFNVRYSNVATLFNTSSEVEMSKDTTYYGGMHIETGRNLYVGYNTEEFNNNTYMSAGVRATAPSVIVSENIFSDGDELTLKAIPAVILLEGKDMSVAASPWEIPEGHYGFAFGKELRARVAALEFTFSPKYEKENGDVFSGHVQMFGTIAPAGIGGKFFVDFNDEKGSAVFHATSAVAAGLGAGFDFGAYFQTDSAIGLVAEVKENWNEAVDIDRRFFGGIIEGDGEKVLEATKDAALMIRDGVVYTVDSVKEGLYNMGEGAIYFAGNSIESSFSDVGSAYTELWDKLDGDFTDEDVLEDAARAVVSKNPLNLNFERVPKSPFDPIEFEYDSGIDFSVPKISTRNTPFVNEYIKGNYLDFLSDDSLKNTNDIVGGDIIDFTEIDIIDDSNFSWGIDDVDFGSHLTFDDIIDIDSSSGDLGSEALDLDDIIGSAW